MKFGTGLLAFAALAAGLAAAVPAIADTSAKDIVVLRKAGMNLGSGTFTGLRVAAAAKVDVKTMAGSADALVKWGNAIPSAFPAGSGTEDTRALPAIWSDRAGFEKYAAGLASAAEKLSVLAKAGDTDGFAAQLKSVGEVCGACHKDYRAR